MSIQVTYIISNINKALTFEWIADLINRDKITLSFVLLNQQETELELFLKKKGFVVERIYYKNKYNIPLAIIKTIRFLLKQKTTVIHTHLFDANIIGLIAAKLCSIKKRIYTRHHSSYHHQYFPNAVKYDMLCNKLATHIIAITSIVKTILIEKEHVSENKIYLIHHGFKLKLFENILLSDIEQLKLKYNIFNNSPVIGVISRYTEWKGIQYIVPAFRILLIEYPQAKLVLANAIGDYSNEIKKILSTIPKQNIIEIEFENNIFALYKMFDVFVHTPINEHSEAFGQIYVEALAAGIPSVFTLSGIANDFIEDKVNALVVNYKDSNSLYSAIKEILISKTLSEKIIKKGKEDVQNLFQIESMIMHLEYLYLNNEK